MLNARRLDFVRSVIANYGEQMTESVKQAMLRQQVIVGMPPYEASLAAGAYSFDVIADPAHWGADADPQRVIAAQSLHPDDSEIRLTFNNATQYPDEGERRFRVHFVHGRAETIETLE